jgi:hypothetical protein
MEFTGRATCIVATLSGTIGQPGGTAMPTLEDTVDFKAITLNDMLEADALGGVGPVGGDDSKYRLWFMVSTAAAGIFAILFVVTLVTGGGGGGGSGSSKSIKLAADQTPFLVETGGPVDLKPGQLVSITQGKAVLVSGIPFIKVTGAKKNPLTGDTTIVSVGVTKAQIAKLNGQKNLSIAPTVLDVTPETTATTLGAPAGESPTPAPAPAPNG